LNCVEFTAAMNFRVYYLLICELGVVTNRTFFVVVDHHEIFIFVVVT